MSVEDNRAVARRFYDEVVNQHDLDALEQLVHEDFVEEAPPPGQEQGRAGLRRWFEHVHTAFPDMRWTVEEMVAEGDTIAVRATVEGTHRATFMGLEPTGRRMSIEAWVMLRFRDGKIAASRFMADTATMLQQLGATSASPNA